MHRQVRRHNDVTVVMSQFFGCHCVEYIKLDTCAKFHDHQSNNDKVMMVLSGSLKSSFALGLDFNYFDF